MKYSVALVVAALTLVASVGVRQLGARQVFGQRGAPPAGGTAAAGQPADAAAGTISGVVRRPDTKEPVDGVTVAILAPGARGIAGAPAEVSVVTDSNGRFTFPNLAAGNYNVRAQREGYFGNAPVGAAAAPQAATAAARIDAQSQTVQLQLDLIPGGSIIGRVTDGTGRPQSNAQVIALRKAYNGGRVVLQQVKTTPTDDRGDFRIWGLPPEQYYVRVQPRTAVAARGLQNPALPTYFPSEVETDRARPIDVAAGREVPADIRMFSGASTTISGRIVRPAAATGPLTRLVLVPQQAAIWDNSDFAQLGSPRPSAGGEETFEVRAAQRGRYHLFAIGQAPAQTDAAGGLRAGQVYYDRIPLDLVGQEIGDLTLTLRPASELKLRLTGTVDDAAGALPLALINLLPKELLPPALSPTNTTLREMATQARLLGPDAQRNPPGGALTSSEMLFTGVIEGDYSLEPPASTAFGIDSYLADIRQGGRSIYETGTISIGRNEAEPVELVFARAAGTVTGTVQDRQGAPAPASRVFLVPDGARRHNAVFYKSATSAADGRFTFRGIAPGQYKVFASQNVPAGAERVPGFLDPFEQQGRSVSVTAGSTISGITPPLIVVP